MNAYLKRSSHPDGRSRMKIKVPDPKLFRLWLQKTYGFQPGSTVSYETYLNGITEIIKKEFGCETLTKLIESRIQKSSGDNEKDTDIEKALDTYSSVIKELRADIMNKRKSGNNWGKSPKTIDNYCSVLRVYGEFLATTLDDKQLRQRFMNRLKTHERGPYKKNGLMFPARLFTKELFGKIGRGDYFTNWCSEQIDETAVYAKDGTKIPFTSIAAVSLIKDREKKTRTWVFLKDKSAEIGYYKDPDDGKTLIALSEKIRSIADLSLDHLYPLEKILTDLKSRLKTIKIITNRVINDSKRGIDRQETYAALRKEMTPEQIKSLIGELHRIKGKIMLELIPQSVNSRKGNS